MDVQKEALPYDPRKDKRRKEALKYAVQTNKALKAIIGILYNATEVDLDEVKAKVKSFASPEAVMEDCSSMYFSEGEPLVNFPGVEPVF
jgi:hypothetical protein